MRLTVDLDDDVVEGINKARETEPAKSFEDIVNESLRAALEEIEKDTLTSKPNSIPNSC